MASKKELEDEIGELNTLLSLREDEIQTLKETIKILDSKIKSTTPSKRLCGIKLTDKGWLNRKTGKYFDTLEDVKKGIKND